MIRCFIPHSHELCVLCTKICSQSMRFLRLSAKTLERIALWPCCLFNKANISGREHSAIFKLMLFADWFIPPCICSFVRNAFMTHSFSVCSRTFNCAISLPSSIMSLSTTIHVFICIFFCCVLPSFPLIFSHFLFPIPHFHVLLMAWLDTNTTSKCLNTFPFSL